MKNRKIEAARFKDNYRRYWVVGIILMAIVLSFIVINSRKPESVTNPTTEAPQILTTETEIKSDEPDVAFEDTLFPIDRLEVTLQKLVSAEMDGRYPGTEGNARTIEYIRSEMRRIGLEAPAFTEDFLMPFEMVLPMKHSDTQMHLTIDDRLYDFTFGEDFNEFVARDFAKGIGTFEGSFKIISDASNLYDFESLGSPEIVIYTESAMSGVSYDALFNEILISPHRPKVVMYESSQQNSGYFVLSPYSKMVTMNDNANGLLIYRISSAVVKLLQESSEGLLSVKTEVSIDAIESFNVIGMIDGTGDEGVMISAHFDHLGNNYDGSYNPGALDNGSGVTTMLALAEAIKETADPKIDYYFIAFNGEEEGMYGSGGFAADKPLDPKAFIGINVDMVGASGDVPLEISATAIQSVALQDKALALAELLELKTFKSDKGSSDHVPLEYAGYVTISLTELDKRFYHTPMDTIENSIDFIKMQKIAYFIYRLVFER